MLLFSLKVNKNLSFNNICFSCFYKLVDKKVILSYYVCITCVVQLGKMLLRISARSLTHKWIRNHRGLCLTPTNVVERKINVQGVDINYVQSGSGSKSVLLMPGALGSAWTDFKPQIENLPKILPDHTLIAWDPPGYGKSIPPKRNFDLDYFHKDADFAVQLMRNLDRSRFSILGWSDGAITAIILAARNQLAVDKLVIWGAGAYLSADEIKAIQNVRDISRWSKKMREPMEKVYGTERFSELWAEWCDAYIAFYKERDGDFCKKEVKQLKAKTFIVHGKKDPMMAAEHIPYLREQIVPCRFFEFPEGKHNIHLRYAEEFNKLVADFLLE